MESSMESQILELVIRYAAAHEAKNWRAEHRRLAELRTLVQSLAKLEARDVEPIGHVAGAFDDETGYDVTATDDGRMCFRLYESVQRDSAVSWTVERAAQVRRDLLRVMLRLGAK